MATIKDLTINNQSLKLLFSENEIEQRICALAEELKQDYKEESPLFIGVLNGSFMFLVFQ